MSFVVRRLGFYVLAAWVAITVNFAIPRLMPGNAIDTMLTKFPTLDASSLKALEAEFGTHTHGSLLSRTSPTWGISPTATSACRCSSTRRR